MCLLASCATPSPPKTGADTARPLAPDPRICAAVRETPRLPDDAGLVRPANVDEQLAMGSFLTWAAELVDAARANQQRAELARKSACPGRFGNK